MREYEQCSNYEHLLEDYFDGLLDAEQRLEFDRHHAECSRCRDAVAVQSQVDAALRSYAETLHPTAPLRLSANTSSNPISTRVEWSLVISVSLAATLLLAVLPSFERQPKDLVLAPEKLLPTTKQNPDIALVPVPPEAEQHPPANITKNSVVAASRIRQLDSPAHLAVVETVEDDEFTFVMLYPKLETSTQGDSDNVQ